MYTNTRSIDPCDQAFAERSNASNYANVSASTSVDPIQRAINASLDFEKVVADFFKLEREEQQAFVNNLLARNCTSMTISRIASQLSIGAGL